jgi:hypothetical protein
LDNKSKKSFEENQEAIGGKEADARGESGEAEAEIDSEDK